jgi:L-asparaginase
MKYKIVTVDPDTAKGKNGSVLIIYTGGTLGMVYDEQGSLKPFNFTQIRQ